MAQYGTVAGSSRDFVEYKGRRIENERRRVLFTSLKDKVNVPREMKMFGTLVYARLRGVDTSEQDAEKKGLFDKNRDDPMDPDLDPLGQPSKDKANRRF